MDRNVVGAVSRKPVNLMHDAVVDLVLGDVFDHPHQLGSVCLARRFASINKFGDNGRPKVIGFALIRFTLGGD
nr:hypothetical protein [Schaalia sp. JY-X169]